jgi:hypothetical protein
VRTKRTLLAATAALAVAGALAAAVAAGTGGQLRIEKGWYDGHEVTFLQPSLFSNDPNGGTLACFGLGPDLSGINRPAQPLYVIFDDTATEDHCDGQPNVLRHNHILPVAPGDPGYTGAWRLVCSSKSSREASTSRRTRSRTPTTSRKHSTTERSST